MTKVTAAIIITNPDISRTESVSPNTPTPTITAVTGSKAPKIAVGVEPIYWTALVVHKKEMAVGKRASPNMFAHKYQ